MKKGLLIMLCLSLLAFAPACHRKNHGEKPMHTKTTKVKTKKVTKIVVIGHDSKLFSRGTRTIGKHTKPTLMTIEDHTKGIMFSVLKQSTILVILGRS